MYVCRYKTIYHKYNDRGYQERYGVVETLSDFDSARSSANATDLREGRLRVSKVPSFMQIWLVDVPEHQCDFVHSCGQVDLA